MEEYEYTREKDSPGIPFGYLDSLPDLLLELAASENMEITRVLAESQGATLVPEPLLDNDHLEAYLDFNLPLNNDLQILENKLYNLGGSCIFTLLKSHYLTLNNQFNAPQVLHLSSSLIEGLLIRYKNQSHDNMVFVNIRDKHEDIIIFNGGTLLFFNSFEYHTKEDLLYYILFVADQLHLNPEKFKLVLSGRISEPSETHSFLFKYIRHISFLEQAEGISLSPVFKDLPRHQYFSLINQYSCGS